ncbi:TPA: hypothetical protein ACW5Q9_001351, partial [Campylobacter jejuni]
KCYSTGEKHKKLSWFIGFVCNIIILIASVYVVYENLKDYQKFTPYGLDFKLYSKDFIAKLDFKNKAYNVLYNTGV